MGLEFLGRVFEMLKVHEQMRIIAKGAAEIIDQEELKKKLLVAAEKGEPLVVKLGLDPTAPDLHLGHAVVLRKIRQIQELGHRAVIILGDFTAMVGDPSGKSKTRKPLTHVETLKNAATYRDQLFRILMPERTEIRFNSQWLSAMNLADLLELAGKTTLARILERDDFKSRFDANLTIGLHELFYPLMQGYDSVMIRADIEMGGTDQRFNILMGRDIQKHYGQESQVALFMPILEGTDGVEKMSKSLGNSIGIKEEPNLMFEKIMTIPDNLIIRYFELCTDLHPDEVDQYGERLERGENPRDVKACLAHEIVRLYHGRESADSAREHFNTVFRDRKLPKDMMCLDASLFTDDQGNTDLVKILVEAGFVSSSSEARRLILQGGVRLNSERTDRFKTHVRDGDVIQAGKKHFVRLSKP
jgi:tyrosyl-tRNA synthetase